MAEHDVLWAKKGIRVATNIYRPYDNYKDHCLSLGLAWLRKVTSAMTYDQRYRLLAPETAMQNPDFLYKTFYYYSNDNQLDLIELSGLTEETFLEYVSRPFVDDPDNGPYSAWWWAYKSQSAGNMYAEPEFTPLRETGYVFFDFVRLQSRSILHVPFEPAMQSEQEKHQLQIEWNGLLESKRKMCEIYDSGGRGYWANGDTSKIIWFISRPYEDEAEWGLPAEGIKDYWEGDILADRVTWWGDKPLLGKSSSTESLGYY